MGIGLTICKAIVQALKGFITVRSVVDEGSTFTFSLPYAPVLQRKETVNSISESIIFPSIPIEGPKSENVFIYNNLSTIDNPTN